MLAAWDLEILGATFNTACQGRLFLCVLVPSDLFSFVYPYLGSLLGLNDVLMVGDKAEVLYGVERLTAHFQGPVMLVIVFIQAEIPRLAVCMYFVL